MECVLTFVSLAILLAAFTALAAAPNSPSCRRKEAFRLAARRFGGRPSSVGWYRHPGLSFQHGTARVLLQSCGKRGASTRLQISWPDPQLRCEVVSRDAASPPAQGLQPMQSGDGLFDDNYLLFGNDEKAVRAFLSEGVQWQIDKLRLYLGNNDVRVSVRGGRLTIEKDSSIRRFPDLEHFTELALELYDQAMLAQSTGIRFLEKGSEASPTEAAVCQVCGDPITRQLVLCRRCRTPHHLDCWRYYGACSTYGCRETRHIAAARSEDGFRPAAKPK